MPYNENREKRTAKKTMAGDHVQTGAVML